MENKSILKKVWVVCALAIFCNALWGSAFPSIKIGYRLFEIPGDSPASQILFAGMRFTLAGVLAVVFGSIIERKVLIPKRQSLGKIVVLSLFQTILQYVFFYLGLAHTSGVKGAIITALNAFFSILVASLIFRQEALTAKKIAACVIGFAGVVLVNVNSGGLGAGMQLKGEGFLIISVLGYAFASSLIKIFSKEEDPVILSGYQFILGGIVMIGCGFALGGRIHTVSVPGVLILIYLALISSVAFSIWGILLKHFPVSKISVFSFTNPVFGVIFSSLFLHEQSQTEAWKIVVALMLVSVGIVMLNYQKTEKTKSE